MTWRVELTGRARKQLGKLGAREARRIIEFLRRLASLDDPRQHGGSLKGELAEFWRFRVGHYRLICEIQDQRLLVLVVRIGHRSQVYRG